MTIESAIALAFATMLFALIPGPGVTALVAQSLARGFRHGATWGVGLVAGDFVYLMLALFGMGYVADSMGESFVILKWAGATYLFWLGFKAWTAKAPTLGDAAICEHTAGTTAKGFVSGACVSLGNPKVIAFYCGFLPGFVDLQALSGWDIVAVVSTIIPTVLAVILGYAFVASRGRKAIGSTRIWKWANRGAGSVMIGTGAVLVTAD